MRSPRAGSEGWDMVQQLASWTDGAAKAAIVEFVDRVVAPGGDDHVPPAGRVAVFDNDGTLWCEKPMPIQLDFTMRRLAEQAQDDPALRERQPYKAAFEQDLHWLGAAMVKHYRGDDADLLLLKGSVERAFEAISVPDYDRRVSGFFDEAVHPTLGRPYRACGYLPMVELLRYLEGNGFTCYIASGGDRDFMRPVAEQRYGVPPERVIGSALGLTYREEGDSSELLYKGAIEFFDDGPEKPVRIWSRIGRRPLLAFGNSNGDIPMLAFAGGPDRPALRLLLLHDDADREFDDRGGAEQALDRAAADGWTVVSIKHDWQAVFTGAPP